MSARETALAALFSVLGGVAGPSKMRNAAQPEVLPAGGLVIQRDGSQTDEEAVFSPLMFNITHQAEIEVMAASEAALDALLVAIAGAVTANRSLSGAVSFAHAEAPQYTLADLEGAAPVFAAQLPVTLMFTATGSPAS